MTKYSYKSLEDYLQSHRLDVDGSLDDGWGDPFPVKGRMIDAAILFADMGEFSSRSNELSPIETLIIAQNFFAWICAEGVKKGHGIIDKYIGDEVMVVFSKDFGSEDPLADAVDAARWMVENDKLGFSPHIGIAVGEVVVGYVGTPLKYNCSVYGNVVTIAQRCCQIKPSNGPIILPAETWGDRKLENVLTKRKMQQSNGTEIELDVPWKILSPRTVTLKGGAQLEVVEIEKLARKTTQNGVHWQPQTVEQRAKEGFEALKQEGSYKPLR